MEFLIVLVVLVLVVLVLSGPFRRRHAAEGLPGELAALEAARDAKYREIREADLDRRTGKLSDADFEAIDAALRAEAVEILRAIDRARASVEA